MPREPDAMPAEEGAIMLTRQDHVGRSWANVLARLEDERIMLQRIAKGESLSDVLNHVLLAVEAQSSVTLRTAIALVDDTGCTLNHAAAPSLPAAYVARTQSVPIGPDVASWGAAAHAKQPVYVQDIDTHPNWMQWRDVAAEHGLRACWSTPIQTPDGRLLGVFSNYYMTPRLPSTHDIEAIALVTRTATLAIERHRTEQALRRSAERWRSMFDGMREGFFLSEALRDQDGRIVDFRFLEVNPAFERQSGMRAGSTLGHTLREMIANVPAEIMNTFVQVMETGEDAHFEFSVPSPAPAWYEARARRDGPNRLMALFLDVTARKLAEAELWEGQLHKNFLLALGDRMRELEQREAIEYAACEGLGTHLNLGSVALVKAGDDGAESIQVITSWSRGGTPHAGLQGMDVAFAEAFATAMRRGGNSYLPPFLSAPNGTVSPSAIVVPLARWGWVASALMAWPTPDCQTRGTDIAIIEEVAERMCGAVERFNYARTLEQRIEHAIAERDRIWRLSPELLAVMDGRGRFVSVNPAVRTILGWTAEEFLSMRLDELIHPQDLEAALAALERIRDGATSGARHHLESRVLKRDESYAWINWSLSWSQGHLYLAGRDDTDLKLQAEMLRETENALRQSQKMEAVGRLTGGIAHDFNNMLQGISGALYLIQRKIAQGHIDQAGRFIGMAMESANRAARLTQRLLTFSRQQPIDPVPFDAAQALRSMADLFQRYTGESVELVFDIDPEIWTVRCDKNQFENVVLNLVINACDAMPEGGLLTVSAANCTLDEDFLRGYGDIEPGEFVEVCVADVGCGMTPDVLAHAFDPFFTTKPLGEGTGLGLSMIYGFTKQAGGVVTIDSEVGVGTAVRVFLPRHAGPPLADAPATTGAEPRHARTEAVVVVVEDDINVREMVRESLVELGLRVLTAIDGDEGLRIVAGTATLDLLVTDVGLPGLNGRQLADAARLHHPGLPVLFMTGYAGSAAKDPQFLGQGMEIIVKPFPLDLLTQRVSTMLREPRERLGA